MARAVVLSFAVLLAIFEMGSCLKCYQCNSATNPECKDGLTPPSKFIVDCEYQDSFNYNRLYLSSIIPSQFTQRESVQNKFCFKAVDLIGTTARTCMPGNSLSEVNQLCSSAMMNKNIGVCSYCDKDHCNGSSAIAASLPVALLALVVSYLFYKQ